MKSFQLSSQEKLSLIFNITDEMVLYMGHPGDEILGLYGHTAYKNPKFIKISPDRHFTAVDLQFKALKYDWKLQTSLKGNALSFEWDTQFC